jgi:hypothetical protein
MPSTSSACPVPCTASDRSGRVSGPAGRRTPSDPVRGGLATLDQLPEGGHEIAGRRGQLFAVDPEIRATRWAKQMEMIQFNKDLALAGSALAFFWVFQNGVDFTITNGLFS